MTLMNGAIRSVAFSILLGLPVFSNSQAEPVVKDLPGKDVSKIVGPEECGECHKAEGARLAGDPARQNLQDAHAEEKQAKQIAGNMGIKTREKGRCLRDVPLHVRL